MSEQHNFQIQDKVIMPKQMFRGVGKIVKMYNGKLLVHFPSSKVECEPCDLEVST